MQPVFEAAATLFSPEYLILLLLGAVGGLIIGALPGLGGGMAIALLLPLTFSMEPGMAVVLLITAYGANDLGGSIPAILVNTPGSAENASTTIDGFPMAQQGKAGEAIGASMLASALGTVGGFIILLLLIPVSRQVILAFSYPEFFMMALFGLTVIATVTQGNRTRGFLAAGVGIMLALVGRDPVFGNERFTFDTLYLGDGLKTIPVVIGVMALGEAIKTFAKGETIAQGGHRYTGKIVGIVDGYKAAIRHWSIVLRSSVIGVVVGAIPGIGGQVAGFMAYGQAVKTSKHPERFGKGAVEGIIAGEAAHNAKEGGALLPTLAFGIPGSSAMAVLIGALILHGIAPGPEMITTNIDIVWILILGWAFGGVVTAVSGSVLGKFLVPITRIPSYYIAPSVILLALIGVYAVDKSIYDVIVCIVMGIVGFEMKKFGFSRVALIIGFILGALVETTYHQTMNSMGITAFMTRPISLGLLIMTLLMFVYPVWKKRREANANRDISA